MVLAKTGLNRIRDMINDDVDYGTLGENGAAPTEADTALGTAAPLTELATTNTTSNKAIKFTYTLPSTGGTANVSTYREFALYGNGTAVFYDRIAFTGVSFTTDGTEDLIIIKTYFIKSV